MKIAIAGGIGSGKSTVLNILKQRGYEVLSADEINNELWQDEKFERLLRATFPEAFCDGKVSRLIIKQIILHDEEKRVLLGSISHPQILERIKSADHSLLFVEVPLIMEKGFADVFDKIIVVTAPKRIRLKRIVARGKQSAAEAKGFIKVQPSLKALKNIADAVICNSHDTSRLEKALDDVLTAFGIE